MTVYVINSDDIDVTKFAKATNDVDLNILKSKEPVDLFIIKSIYDLKSFQETDTFCLRMAKKVLSPDKTENDFVLADDILYHVTKLSVTDFSQHLQVVLPQALIKEVLV